MVADGAPQRGSIAAGAADSDRPSAAQRWRIAGGGARSDAPSLRAGRAIAAQRSADR